MTQSLTWSSRNRPTEAATPGGNAGSGESVLVNPQRCWYAGDEDLLCNTPLDSWRNYSETTLVRLTVSSLFTRKHHRNQMQAGAKESYIHHVPPFSNIPTSPGRLISSFSVRSPRTFPPVPTPDNDPELFSKAVAKCLQDNKIKVLQHHKALTLIQ